MNLATLGPVELVTLVILIGFAAYIAWRAIRVSDVDLDRWADANRVARDHARGRIRDYLVWSRSGRACGFIIAVALAIAARQSPGPLEALIFGLVGYLLGTLAVELIINKPLPTAGAASLTPRLISRYVPAPALIGLRAGAFGFWLVEGLYLLAYQGQEVGGSSQAPQADPGRFVATTLALAIVIGGVELTLRLIVSRRQPALTEEQAKVDDAIRSASARAVTGGGLALLCLAVAGEAMGFAVLGGMAGAIAVALAATAIIGALVGWLALTRPRAGRVQADRGALSS